MPSAQQSFVLRAVLQLFLSPHLNGGAACILRLGIVTSITRSVSEPSCELKPRVTKF